MKSQPSPSHCFQVLQLPQTATEDQIKTAYRQLALRYHPDRNPNNKAAEEKFKELVQAYQTLLVYVRQRSEEPDLTSEPYAAAPNWKESAEGEAMAAFQEWLNTKRRCPVTATELSAAEQRLKPELLRKFRRLLEYGEWQSVIRAIEELSPGLQTDAQIRRLKSKAYYAQALRLINQWQYDPACRFLQEAVWSDPTYAVLRSRLRRIHLYVGRLRELEAFVQAVAEDYPQAPAQSSPAAPPRSPSPSNPREQTPDNAVPATVAAETVPARQTAQQTAQQQAQRTDRQTAQQTAQQTVVNPVKQPSTATVANSRPASAKANEIPVAKKTRIEANPFGKPPHPKGSRQTKPLEEKSAEPSKPWTLQSLPLIPMAAAALVGGLLALFVQAILHPPAPNPARFQPASTEQQRL